MDAIWQWAWDRYRPWFVPVACAITFLAALPVFLLVSFVIVAVEQSDRYLEAGAVTAVTSMASMAMTVLPGLRWIKLVQRWATGRESDPMAALNGTYVYARGTVSRVIWVSSVWTAISTVVVAEIIGADPIKMVQYGILGAAAGAGVQLIAAHSFIEAGLRPARVAIAGETDIGDDLPRSRPSFASRSNVSVLAVAFSFAFLGAMFAAASGEVARVPVLSGVIAGALTLAVAMPITVGMVFAPSMRPIRDLAEGTQRVAAGDYSQRLPVVQDDDLGALAGSFNRMQAGLAERQRLQVAFGTYVDPVLAGRLLEQGDDVFTGERREVTVLFVDVRDFTPFAEANTAEDTVARLNALFEIVVPAVVGTGGHVNKFLGDGAMAVFGAPNELAGHADAALDAAMRIQRLVGERFGAELRIGIGINTGLVIAGTLGGAGHLEFTLIGDTVNVASRVEQLTKITGDAILLTDQTLTALDNPPDGLIDRGSHSLKGKSAAVRVFGTGQ